MVAGTTKTTSEEMTMMNASYRVIATDSDGREVSTHCTHKMGVQVPLDLAAARRVAAMTRDEIIEYLDRLGLDGERWTEAPGRADMDDAELTRAFEGERAARAADREWQAILP